MTAPRSPSPPPPRDPWLSAAGAPLLAELTRPWAPPRGARVLAAVSGGADSIALMRLLAALAPGRGWSVEVASLDHGLRGAQGAEDLEFVARAGRGLGLPVHTQRRRVERRRGESVESAARRVRHAFLRETAAAAGAEAIALGHTADDQAETLLMRLGRGAGLRGAGGMRRWRAPLWRPLLRVRRGRLRELLEETGTAFREDPSNARLDAERNRVRHQVLPALLVALGDQAVAGLARSAEIAQEDEDWLEQAARTHLAGRRLADGFELGGPELRELPGPLLRRLLRAGVRPLYEHPPRLSERHLRSMERLARAEGPGTRLSLPGGVEILREGGRLLARPAEAGED